MQAVNLYINFDGNCFEAFNYYKEIFGTEFNMVMRFKDAPPSDDMPAPSAEDAEKIMHISLPIGEGTSIMGSDVAGPWAGDFKVGNNFQVNVHTDSRERADAFFAHFAQGGIPIMPMADTFWGAYFGMCIDKFGVSWMINVENK